MCRLPEKRLSVLKVQWPHLTASSECMQNVVILLKGKHHLFHLFIPSPPASLAQVEEAKDSRVQTVFFLPHSANQGERSWLLDINNFASTLLGTIWAAFQKWKGYNKRGLTFLFHSKKQIQQRLAHLWEWPYSSRETRDWRILFSCPTFTEAIKRQSAYIGIVAGSYEAFHSCY